MLLAITGAEMMTAIGPDLNNSCAAIRAGLIRSEEIPYFSILDGDSQETRPLIARPIHGFTEGFFVQGLWIRIGLACLNRMVKHYSLPDPSDAGFWSATGLLAVTPPIADARFQTDRSYTT